MGHGWAIDGLDHTRRLRSYSMLGARQISARISLRCADLDLMGSRDEGKGAIGGMTTISSSSFSRRLRQSYRAHRLPVAPNPVQKAGPLEGTCWVTRLCLSALALSSILGAQALRALTLVLTLSLPPAIAGEIDIETTRLHFSPVSSSDEPGSRLRWRGGFKMKADAEEFGGFSGLAVTSDGRWLTAVTDRGSWLTAELQYDASGDLVGLTSAVMDRLLDPNGRPLETGRQSDAESLAVAPDGAVLIAFEREHKIWRYSDGVHAVPEPLHKTDGFRGIHNNRGIEALVTLADGRLLGISELSREPERSRGFIFDGTSWSELTYSRLGDFQPSGAARLPSGDLLILERSFSRWSGFATRLRTIDDNEIGPSAVLTPREFADLRTVLNLMNFEGLAVHSGPAGGTRITLITDNNFNPVLPNMIISLELIDTK